MQQHMLTEVNGAVTTRAHSYIRARLPDSSYDNKWEEVLAPNRSSEINVATGYASLSLSPR